MIASPAPTNFAHLRPHDEQLLRLGLLAEKYFPEDPNTSLLKLRQFAELLAQLTASHFGQFTSTEESQYELLRRLQDAGYLPREVAQFFGEVHRTGNAANHALADDYRSALATLKICWQLGIWFHRTFKDPAFKSGPFQPPKPPPDETVELRAELGRLRSLVAEHEETSHETAQRLEFTGARLKDATDEQSFWAELAAEAEHSRVALEQKLAGLQAVATSAPKQAAGRYAAAANTAAAALVLDEAETRKLIDEQLTPGDDFSLVAGLLFSEGVIRSASDVVVMAHCASGSDTAWDGGTRPLRCLMRFAVRAGGSCAIVPPVYVRALKPGRTHHEYSWEAA